MNWLFVSSALSFYCSLLFHVHCIRSVENMSAASCFYFSQLEYSVYEMLFTCIISYSTLAIKHHTAFTDEETRVQKNEATYWMLYYTCIKCKPHLPKLYTCCTRLHGFLLPYYVPVVYIYHGFITETLAEFILYRFLYLVW